MHHTRRFNDFFKPQTIKKLKQQNIKLSHQLPDWQQVDTLVESIYSDTITQQDLAVLNKNDIIALLIEDLLGYDFTYHLIVNQKFDLFLNILQQTKSLGQQQLVKLYSSLLKGIIKIAKEENFKILVSFVKQFKEAMIVKENQLSSEWKLNIEVESHFNYTKVRWEAKLLLELLKLIDDKDQKVIKLKETVTDLKYKWLLKSTIEERKQSKHLNWKKYITCPGQLIQILQAKQFDLLIDESDANIFNFEYGHSIYMRMMKTAPYDFLTLYHQRHIEKIKFHLKTQRKNGYNILHCLSENPDSITSEFLDILNTLDLEEEKHLSYFEQIPAVMYLEKAKQINQDFLQFLFGDILTKDQKELEGAQLIMMIYAQQSFKEEKISSLKMTKDYLRRQRLRISKHIKGKMRKYKVPSKYKKPQAKTLADKAINKSQINLNEVEQQMFQGYCEVNVVHKILKQKNIDQKFPISHYTFPIGHMKSYLSKVEQSLAEEIENTETLDQFIEYLQNEFCSEINQNHKLIIEQLIIKLNLNITIPELIFQRKIMILNSLYKQNKQQKVKNILHHLLDQNSNFNLPYFSYTSFQDFQQCLFYNGLISVQQCQNYEPQEWLMNFIRYRQYNKERLLMIAKEIPQLEKFPTVHNLIEFYCNSNLIHKFIYQVWFHQKNLAQLQIVNVFRKDIAKQLTQTIEGLNILFSISEQEEDDRFTKQFNNYYRQIVFNFNEEPFKLFYQQITNIIGDYRYQELTQKHKFQICNYKQSQLKFFFLCQLNGIKIQFIPNKRIKNLQSTCIEESVVLKQIQQNKTFIQVLLNNDEHHKFLQQAHKYYPEWVRDNKLNYLEEAIKYEAYNNLKYLEEQVWIDEDNAVTQQEELYKCLFQAFKYENINIYSYGFRVYPQGFKRDEKVFTTIHKADKEKINRQLKNFFNIFSKVQDYAQENLEYNFLSSRLTYFEAEYHLLKILLYYLDDENLQIFSEQIVKFFKIAHPLTIVFYYKVTQNVEQTIKFLQNPEIQVDNKALLKLAKIAKEEQLITYLIEKTNEISNQTILSILVLKYIKQFDNLKYIKQYFYSLNLTEGQILSLYSYCLQNDQIRKAEFILLYLDSKQIQIKKQQIRPPKGKWNYSLALSTSWSVGLNLKQFINIIKHNELSNEQTEAAIYSIVCSGQFEKLRYISNRIQTDLQLINLTIIAVQNYVQEAYPESLRTIPQFKYEKKYRNQTLTQLDKTQSDYLFTERRATAEQLLDIVYEREVDINQFYSNYVYFQLVFPNPKFVFEDINFSLLDQILQIVYRKFLSPNWEKYLQIFEQTAEYYLKQNFDFTRFYYKKGEFYQKTVDIFLSKIEPNFVGTESEKILKDVKKLQLRKRTDSLGQERFRQILSNNFFQAVTFSSINITPQMINIYYGQEFDQPQIANIEELFIALLSKNRYSVNSILMRLNNLRDVLTENRVIQYLIMHGGQDTTIDALKLLGQDVNESLFYYQDIPLLTYIVFKKWYKLYYFAEKYLVEQWSLQPKILDQIVKNDINQLTIHQFAQLNQFYVYFALPISKKLILRSSQFMIPNQYNKNLRSFKIYEILTQLFKRIPRRALEVYSLQLEAQIDTTYTSLVEAFQNLPNSRVAQEILLHTINCENTPFSYLLENYKSEQRNLIKQLLEIFHFEDSKSLTEQSQEDQKKLWSFVYKKFGLYHPVIETLVRISPNEFAGSFILDSPNLSLIVAQFANYQTVMDLANVVDQEGCNLRFISKHFVKVTLMIRFGQKFEQLLHKKELNRIHQQNYVEALNTVDLNFQGSINIQFINEMVTLLDITNPSIQVVDNLYNQIKDEPNSLKKAFRLLIKIKEFNLQLDIVKDQASLYSDNLQKNFKFSIADKFDLKKEENEAVIYLPFEYEQEQLKKFLQTIPTHFKELYVEAIMKHAKKRKGFKKKISLNIKFEENNLSPLYNDLRYQISQLWAQQSPKFLLETSKPYKIQGWLECNEKVKDENTFVYTQNFLQTASLSQYQNQVAVFFNERNLHNQAYIQNQISESLDTLMRQVARINQIKVQIDIQSFLQLCQSNQKLQKIYNKDLLQCVDAFTNYKTLINILVEVIGYLSEILELFELNKSKQVLVRFEETSNIGQNTKLSILLDNCFGFCKPQLTYQEQSLVVTLPVSENINYTANEQEFLDQLFNLNDVDHFIQKQFSLASISEAKIHRFQFDKFIGQTCYMFKQKSNIEIQVKLKNEDILFQIQNLDLQEQELYLKSLKIYFSNIFYEDLIDFIRSERFNSLYYEKLLNGNLIAKPEFLGYLAVHNDKSLQNHFGLLVSKEQFMKCQAKNIDCHVCFSQDNQHQLMFCQYQGTKNGQSKFKQFKKVFSKKQKIVEIDSEKISGAIIYYKELPKNCEGMFVFIDNDGKFYLNSDEDIQNKVAPKQSLTQLLQLSNLEYSIVFSKEILNQEQFYFNEKQFRLQNVLEISAIDNVKDYQLKMCRINKSQIQIDPRQITLKKNKSEQNQIGYTIHNGIYKIKLLSLFSKIIQRESNKAYQIPPENSILDQNKREAFIQYCKEIKGNGENPIKVGIARNDEFIFFNILNKPITKPVESLNLNCYFQHEKFDEIVYHPVVTQRNKSYYFYWAPTIKGLYNIFINGHKLNFQLKALAGEVSKKEFRIKKQVPEAQYFNKIEFQLELFDIYGNFIQKQDGPIQQVTAISKNPVISIKQSCEYQNDHCSIQLTLCNLEKVDNEIDVCELEFQLAGSTLIQKVDVIVQPKTLTYERIYNFTKQFRYPGLSQFLISRQNFIGNILQFTNFREQKKLKISFHEELAQDQGGPTREFFELLGKELKNEEHKLFKPTSPNPNFYFFDREIAKNTCYGYVVGSLVAYALGNNQKIGMSFALPFWKVLCGFPIEFKDLQYIIEPQEYKNYLSLKEMNQEQIESLVLYFVSSDLQELCSDGKKRKVTQQSVEEYLQLTAKYLLYYKYEKAIQELRKGFSSQFNIKLLTENFTLCELNQLIDTIDYHIDKQCLLSIIKFSRRGNFIENYLTQFISEADQQTLELFLQFITGSKFINFEQQGNKIEVQCDIGISKQRLPTSRTCSGVLIVPHYDSYALFKMKLNQALEWGTNFFGQN